MLTETNIHVREHPTKCEPAALGAGGLVPVTDREGILGLGSGLRVAGEEARE